MMIIISTTHADPAEGRACPRMKTDRPRYGPPTDQHADETEVAQPVESISVEALPMCWLAIKASLRSIAGTGARAPRGIDDFHLPATDHKSLTEALH